MTDKLYDCVIVGGGPAGLSAAVYLGRLRRQVLVLDDKQGRSTWHQVNRNYLGFPDGLHATALRELGEKQAARYGVEFLAEQACHAAAEGEGRERRFTVATDSRNVVARTIILANGVSDRFPQFEGSEECIGRSMFWCIICDGYEAIDKRVVVLGHDDHAAATALQLLVFTREVTLVSGPERLKVSSRRKADLIEHGVQLYESDCSIYECGSGQLHSLTLTNGERLDLDLLFVSQATEPNNQLAKELEIYLTDGGYLRVDAEQLTNIEGVYAAGDITRLHNHQVSSAVHEGGMAAAAVNYYLYDDWQKD